MICAGVQLELKYLSYGTQEQFSVLTRLAYADLLKEAGIPTLIILGDCCVHTDSERRQHIERVAGRMQPTLDFAFTCHPEAWDDRGIAARQIEEMVPA